MNILIRNRNVEVTDGLRAHIEKRLGFTLGRFGAQIGRVVVRFTDGGDEKRCEVQVGLRPRVIRAEDADKSLFAAVDHASARASRSVARVLERELTTENST